MNKDQCWGNGLYCTLFAKTSIWNCQCCGVKAPIGKPTGECAVCMFQRLESATPGDGCQCTSDPNAPVANGGNRQLILETRAAQWRARITHNFAGVYIELPQAVSGPIRAAWDQQEAELRAQQRPAASQQPLPLVPPPSKAPPPPSSTPPAALAPPQQHPTSSTSSSTPVAQQHPAVPHALPPIVQPVAVPEPGTSSSTVPAPPPGLGPNDQCPFCGGQHPMSMPVRVRCMCHVLPDSERKPTWLAPVLIPDDDVPPT